MNRNEFGDFSFEFLALTEYTEKLSPLESCECPKHCHKEKVGKSVVEYFIKSVFKEQKIKGSRRQIFIMKN